MTSAATAARHGLNFGRLLLTLLVFVAIGPLVGGVLMIVGIGVTIGIQTGDYRGMFATIATMMIYGLWTSWFMGALPSLAVGLFVALADAFRRNGWRLTLIVGCAAGIAMAVAAGGLQNHSVGACYFVACVAATMVCYAATRGFARR